MGVTKLGVIFLWGALGYCVEGETRQYYIAIEEVEWDYAPSGRNLMKDIPLDEDEDASFYTTRSDGRIGRVYKKAVYRQYTDATFVQETQRPEHWGLIGPPIKAEVGDLVIVHVKSNVSHHRFSIHPHGVFYTKDNEGALYHDKTAAELKLEDAIRPGGYHVYEWNVSHSFAPTTGDPNCVTWAYHSHAVSNMDTNSGLVGPLIVCRPGTLDEDGNRNDVDKEFYFLITVLDENESKYLDENIQKYTTSTEIDTGDADFQESNKMRGINGRVYGNLQGLSACKGDRIAIYSFGVGTELDLHSIHFHGQTLVTQGHRQDTISIFPGVFVTSLLHADNVGTFDVSCSVNDHFSGGMSTKLTVSRCQTEDEQQQELEEPEDGLTGTVREYFLAIHEEDWNYGPSGYDVMYHSVLTQDRSDSATFFKRGADRIGGIYEKAVFHGYQSAEYMSEITKPKDFGILGPLIGVEVGDTVRITLKNFARSQTYNIEPHGVFYNDLTEVRPGETHTYEWTVPESVSPTDIDNDCVAYVYTSSVDPVKDTNSGLVGPMLVCKRGTLVRNLLRRALYILFTVFDENSSHYIENNIRRFTADPDGIDTEDEEFRESNLMHAINGLTYGNLAVRFCKNTETDIHVMAIGTEVDMHSFFLSGIFYKFRNEYTNVLSVFPHTTASATVAPTEVGFGDLICLIDDHLTGGMRTNYQVVDCGVASKAKNRAQTNKVRTYYVAAVDEIWDYSPWKTEILDHNLSAFTTKEKGRLIGSKYWKAIFHGFTDETFTTREKKPEHLGSLGPIIKAEEGDEIRVVFKNLARGRYNMVPWGLQLRGFPRKVAHGETVTYVWTIPKEVVPTDNQPACNGHVYVSIQDAYTGLIGPLIICRRGALNEDGSMSGVDAEFFLSFLVYDESKSRYLDRNIKEFAEADPEIFNKRDEEFLENNLMHGINGRLGFLEGLKMYEGDRVIWHLLGLGSEVDLHTIHFHAHAYNYTSDYKTHADVFPLFPGKTGTVEMVVDAVGSWLLHCHVNDHMVGGMTTTYTVLPRSERGLTRTPCYTDRTREGDHIHCTFESPRELEDITKQVYEDSLEVCPIQSPCLHPMKIDRGSIISLSIKSAFYINPGVLQSELTTATVIMVNDI